MKLGYPALDYSRHMTTAATINYTSNNIEIDHEQYDLDYIYKDGCAEDTLYREIRAGMEATDSIRQPFIWTGQAREKNMPVTFTEYLPALLTDKGLTLPFWGADKWT